MSKVGYCLPNLCNTFNDESYRLTAVFCMRFIQEFAEQIVEALESETPDIHYEAVCAAGNWKADGGRGRTLWGS